MKKVLFLISVLFISINVLAQTEHLKFMGIPLTGSINSFQSKLNAKGIKYDAKMSSELSVGIRAFRGMFSGEKADIYVYYNESTKIVYRAKAVVTCVNKEIGNNKYESFESMLREKYSNHIGTAGENDGYRSYSILVTDSQSEYTMGYVSLYRTNPPYSFMDEVYIHIDYEDVTNQKKNQNRNMDDL